MTSRRNFLTQVSMAGAAMAATPLAGLANGASGTLTLGMDNKLFDPIQVNQKSGVGGVAAGNGFHINTDEQIQLAYEGAWAAGARFFDTSPLYGLGLSERRLGRFLFDKDRKDYLVSTKIGRILEADPGYKEQPGSLWHGRLNFKYRYDYTADGVRRSVEDSLQRMGLTGFDFVFVHDLSPDNNDMRDRWTEHFDIAAKGAFRELSRMREEGIIKGWGLGVNRPEPILKALQVAEPNIMLVAIQYSLVYHDYTLTTLFPALQKAGVQALIGGPLNAGFLAGKDRFNYGPSIPPEMLASRSKMYEVARNHKVDLRTAALHFAAAHPVVAAVIPGVSTNEQAVQNRVSMYETIPAGFWQEMKAQKLIHQDAPVSYCRSSGLS